MGKDWIANEAERIDQSGSGGCVFLVPACRLQHLPFDGLEALTPEPQGDVTLDEMAAHLGDKILLDGIPAVLFTPTYTRDELMATVERVVALFHPRLVLGVSDEVPEGADAEAIERVKLVVAWARSHHKHSLE